MPSKIQLPLMSTVVRLTWLGSVAAAQSAVPGAVPEMYEEESPVKVHCDPETVQAEEVSHRQRPALLPPSLPYEMKLVLQAGSCCAAR